MTDSDIFLLDSNILIYNYDTANPRKHNIAKGLIDKCWKNNVKFAISSQNLSEFFSATTGKKILSKQYAITIISDIINFHNWIKIDFNHKTVLDAAIVSEEHNMSYRDSLLAVTMKQNSIFNIYTENAQDFKIPWINTVNPFAKK